MNETLKKKLLGFFRKYPLKKAKKGEMVLKPGESFPGIIFVKSGYVTMYVFSKDGKQVTLPLWRPLFLSSMVCAITGMENKYFFEAISPTEYWIAPLKEWVDFAKSDMRLYRDLTKMVVRDFVDLTGDTQKMVSGDARVRVASLLASMATKYGEKTASGGGGVRIKFNVPHRLLASMTGLTRETVTLQLLKLQKEKVVRIEKRRIIITNKEKLETWATL